MSEVSRDQEGAASAQDRPHKTAYETPVLKRLGSIAEVTQGGSGLVATDPVTASV
jgi:hypothetical protein